MEDKVSAGEAREGVGSPSRGLAEKVEKLSIDKTPQPSAPPPNADASVSSSSEAKPVDEAQAVLARAKEVLGESQEKRDKQNATIENIEKTLASVQEFDDTWNVRHNKLKDVRKEH